MIATFYRVTNYDAIDYWTAFQVDAEDYFDSVSQTERQGLTMIMYTGDPVDAFIREMNKIGGWVKTHRVIKP